MHHLAGKAAHRVRRALARWRVRRTTRIVSAVVATECVAPHKGTRALFTPKLFAGCAEAQRGQAASLPALDDLAGALIQAGLGFPLVYTGNVALQVVLARKRATAFRLARPVWARERLGPRRVGIVCREMRVEVISTSKCPRAFGALEALLCVRISC